MNVLVFVVYLVFVSSFPAVKAVSDRRCTLKNGRCQYTSSSCSGGSFRGGLCSGPINRRCCIRKPTSTVSDRSCTLKKGRCQYTSSSCSGGSFVGGLCSGPSNRRCCIRKQTSIVSGNPDVVSRASWGARSTRLRTIRLPVSQVFIHHTAGKFCSSQSTCSTIVREIQNYHIDIKGWTDIAYSFLVGEDGRIYEGRGWNKEGAHTKGYNSKSIAISFMGDFSFRNPNTASLNAAKMLIANGIRLNKISGNYKLSGHRDARGANTACPGNYLYNLIRTWQHYTSST